MIFEFLIGFCIAFCIYLMLHSLKSRLMRPLRSSERMRISTVLALRGSVPELEHTVRSIVWLRKSGRLDTEIVLRDCGMDEETGLVAQKLCENFGIKLIY